ncbi:MAG: L-fucose/L-arabinose isomerase family protein [Planctomycetota bacterium]|jgi:L-fucose isomerase-like protein
MATATLGVVIGNRDFFPDQLVAEARRDVAALLGRLGIEAVMVADDETKLGGVETHADARRCAELFRRHRDRIDGVLVVLPNFGDEKGVADTLKLAGLGVPVLVQGYPDDPDRLDVARRRDAFCGKISVCNNLVQSGIPFSLTREHVTHPSGESFRRDLEKFSAVCRVVRGLRRARLGAIGARPGAFNTVRYSEKILEANGISVTTIDLSEILGAAERLDPEAESVGGQVDRIRRYAEADGVPRDKLVQMARIGVVIDEWMEANALDASAIQCWTSVQQSCGVNVCTLMSMMSERLLPSACEVDVTGALSMYALQLASATPAALVDWNNNFGHHADRCVLFHCGNWAKSFLPGAKIGTAPILGSILGEEKTYGALEGRAPAGPFTFARLTTDDTLGAIRSYVGEGSLTDDELATFGSRAVARIPDLQKLMRYVCAAGFEHHVAISASQTAGVLEEAFETYLDWDVYYHQRPDD